jgi:hypothetical protein
MQRHFMLEDSNSPNGGPFLLVIWWSNLFLVSREKSGGCMGNMQLIGPVKNQSDGVYIHRFERRRGGEQGVTGLIVGDRVVVSDHDLQLIGVAAGYVTDVSSTAVSCSLDR